MHAYSFASREFDSKVHQTEGLFFPIHDYGKIQNAGEREAWGHYSHAQMVIYWQMLQPFGNKSLVLWHGIIIQA